MRLLIPVLNSRTNWWEERWSKLSLEKLNSPFQGPSRWHWLHSLSSLSVQEESTLAYMESCTREQRQMCVIASYFPSKWREGLRCLSGDSTPSFMESLGKLIVWASGLKTSWYTKCNFFQHQASFKPFCCLFPPLWFLIEIRVDSLAN